jgi:predicted kinase
VYVLVTGPPAAGKSMLSRRLAPELGLPLLAKDTIKDALAAVLGAPTVDDPGRRGAAAVKALLALARDARCGVLDSVWVDPPTAIPALQSLPGPVVEVFCRVDQAMLEARYERRARTGAGGQFDDERPRTELWNTTALRPLAGGWPVIVVDTDNAVDITALATAVYKATTT